MAAGPMDLLATLALSMPVLFRVGVNGNIESVLFGVPDVQTYWAPLSAHPSDHDDNDHDGQGSSEGDEDAGSNIDEVNDSGMEESSTEEVSMDDSSSNEKSNNNMSNDGDENNDDDDVVFLEEIIVLQ